MICSGHMYLWYTIWVHRFSPVIRVHPIFEANAWANDGRFFSPHPPHFLGMAILFHPIHAKMRFSVAPFHRYMLHVCCNLDRMLRGIHAKAIQKTEVASKTRRLEWLLKPPLSGPAFLLKRDNGGSKCLSSFPTWQPTRSNPLFWD